ncbi:DNA ligase D [Legionella erythra]|uniref:DNA ligase (ATP) n=1 Tax=Legionella erythra TaxID=448 RepID=A0A0W0TTZ0_LEGER|nr:DNA ligase D [Legionella erythra]KTC99169.1 putative ATP-dependent DNA ligase YkoU [Legionella erythra]
MGLETYHKKRNFKKTPEPRGRVHRQKHFLYVIQKHAASHLHYDFRLELDGVLKSWAIPKGPCLDNTVKRLAVHVEDHPIEYGTFEGIIPKGEYGGGTVMLWDKGEWIPLDKDPRTGYEKGHLRFELKGKKLKGRWDLIRFKEDKNWFLIKFNDEYAQSAEGYDITTDKPLSVLSGQSIDDIADQYERVWSSKEKKSQRSKKSATAGQALQLNQPKSPFPETVSAQLATLVNKPPRGEDWLQELKLDGYRILAMKNNKKIRLITRNHNDWTPVFPAVVEAIADLPVKKAIFDGEVVVLNGEGRPDFQSLQNAIKDGLKAPFIYYLFDLLYLEQYDLRPLPLIERKSLLAPLIAAAASSILRYSDHIIGQGDDVFKQACDMGMEGIIAKQIHSPYEGKRSLNWLKIKCSQRQEFVIGGFSSPKGARDYFGSLFIGVFNVRGEFVHTGNVGTGFTDKTIKSLYEKLKPLIIDKSPFKKRPPDSKTATWVKPELVIEVAFSQWTQDGRLRHPSFKGLRLDKSASDVIEEKVKPVETIEDSMPKSKSTAIILSNPDKVLYREDSITKQDLYDYYERISDHILPYISGRFLSLVRCPSSYTECFYQKHLNQKSDYLFSLPVRDKNGEMEDYLYLKDKQGLLSLVQMGVLEIHPWGSTVKRYEYPDILIFDLDPGSGVAWGEVVNAALDIRDRLATYQLRSFVKTTGGKGLHVVIPIKPEHDWDMIKQYTHVFVEYLEKINPKKYISTMAKVKRKGKIFVDYLRNQRGATAIAPYSTRARLHAPVAVPLHWEELSARFDDHVYTIHTLPQRLEKLKSDPWADFWTLKQPLRTEK